MNRFVISYSPGSRKKYKIKHPIMFKPTNTIVPTTFIVPEKKMIQNGIRETIIIKTMLAVS